MNHYEVRAGTARSLFGPRRRRIRAAAFLVLLSGPLAAQGTPSVHVSTTSLIQVGGPPTIDDASIVEGAGSGPVPVLLEGHWQGLVGFVPSDVDGFARRPGTLPGSAGSIAVSLLSNERGFLDGDVLGLAPGGGFEVLVHEDDIATALGVPGASIDLDAIDYDQLDCLLFSLQSDLTGTVLGTVQDGDVLRFERSGGVAVVLSEAEVQQNFTLATGSIQEVGDVQAIECVAGEVWVCVQAPSSWDGAVIACGGTPRVVLDETAMGLGGAEVDGLSELQQGESLPVMRIAPTVSRPGDVLAVDLFGTPNSVQVALVSGATGWVDFSAHPGFGAWYLDPLDPWLAASLTAPPYAVLNGSGRLSASWRLPLSPVFGPGFTGEDGWSFQMLDLATGELSAPFRVERL